MPEFITTYTLKNATEPVPMDRSKFYREQENVYKKTHYPTKAVEIVNLFLFNNKKQIILQKRSLSKNHNAGLIDKAVGGHVNFGDSPNYTMMVETVQELHVPSMVLATKTDFIKTYKLLKKYADNFAIIRSIDTRIFHLKKMFKKKEIVIANKSHTYFGVYGGDSRPADAEASGVLYYSLENLRKEMRMFPHQFTDDLHVYMHTYKKQMEEFLRIL